MSDASNARMISMYMEEASAPMFLSGFFRSPSENFHTTEKVEIDIMRDDEDVAIVIQDLSAGARHNENTKYTNKGFTPPIFDEQGAVHAYSQINRVAGQDPFQNPDYGANATREAFRIFRKLEKKIRRSIELMASQVLQTGTLSLTDSAGTVLYTLDFQAKATHQVTVGTEWAVDGATGDPLGDVESLATVVRRDGKHQPEKLIFGTTAFRRFLANADVKARLDNRAMQVGTVAPETRGQGATFQGFVWIGHYRFEMWTYDGFYKDPQTGNPTSYVADDKVIMVSKDARLDLSFGAIPLLARPDERVMPFLPPRMSSGDRGLDLTVNAWMTPDNKHLMVSAGTRPLTIPTAIDTFGCLDIVP